MSHMTYTSSYTEDEPSQSSLDYNTVKPQNKFLKGRVRFSWET